MNAADRHRRRQALDDAQRKRGRPLRTGHVAGQDGEFVSAQARHQIAVADSPQQARADVDQHLVADRVAVDVVDLLEAVEVEQQDRMGLGRGGNLAERGFQAVVELPSVRQAGQRIMQRQGHHLPLGGNPEHILSLMLSRAPPSVEEDPPDHERRERHKLIDLYGFLVLRSLGVVLEDIDFEREQRRDRQDDSDEADIEQFDPMSNDVGLQRCQGRFGGIHCGAPQRSPQY